MSELRERANYRSPKNKIGIYLGLIQGSPQPPDERGFWTRLVENFKRNWKESVLSSLAVFTLQASWDSWRWTIALPASVGIAVLWLVVLVAVSLWRDRRRPPV